ncbi:MAG: hypothetical protein O7D86_07085 [Proteobacteria bacterium]|nr:hypothetical protein [Pseudomonadota bacterium]
MAVRLLCARGLHQWPFSHFPVLHGTGTSVCNDRRVHADSQLVTEYHSDLDILVLVHNGHKLRKSNIWHHIEEDIEDSPRIQTWVHLISEYVKRFNSASKKASCYIVPPDITLAEPVPMTQEKRRDFTIRYLNKFYPLSVSKKAMFELAYQRRDYIEAIWNLHQLCERLFDTWLLVHTHYKPREHDLFKLRTRVATREQVILELFPQNTKEDKARLDFLNKAYVDARYLLQTYTVDPDELDKMAGWVQAFQRWVLPGCLAFIDGLLPGQNFSATYTPPGDYLDLAQLKTTPLPEAVIAAQLKALAEKEAALVKQDRELQLEREAKEEERRLKEEALREKAASEQREKTLIEKLKQAGIE